MIRLIEPEYDFSEVLDECIKGITGNNNFKDRMKAAKSDLVLVGDRYICAGKVGELYTINPIDTTTDKNPIAAGVLLKSELINLYEYYFRDEKKLALGIYDKLLNSAHEQCPFCGGIGVPRNLDHFLPKAHFPQFSTLPHNLVPSCRDCNMDGKAESFARRDADQIIQPYVDHDRFFNSQWIFAEYTVNSSIGENVISYYVKPPEDWDQVHKDRVHKHFQDFNLAKRYSVKAAQMLPTTLGQINKLQKLKLSNSVICGAILSPGIAQAPFVNHWQKGMFQALYDFFDDE